MCTDDLSSGQVRLAPLGVILDTRRAVRLSETATAATSRAYGIQPFVAKRIVSAGIGSSGARASLHPVLATCGVSGPLVAWADSANDRIGECAG